MANTYDPNNPPKILPTQPLSPGQSDPSQLTVQEVGSPQTPNPAISGANPPQPAPQATPAPTPTPPAGGTFYLPTTPVQGFSPQTVFNAQGQPLSMADFLAQGGKADMSNVQKIQSITPGQPIGQQPPPQPAPQQPTTQPSSATPPGQPTGTTPSTAQPTPDGSATYLGGATVDNNVVANDIKAYNEIITSLGLPALKATIDSTMQQYKDLENQKIDEMAKINEDPWLSVDVRSSSNQALQDKFTQKEALLTSMMTMYNTMYSQGISQAGVIAGQVYSDQTVQRANVLAAQQANQKLVMDYGIDTPFYTIDGHTIIRSSDGKVYSGYDQWAADGGGQGTKVKMIGGMMSLKDQTAFQIALSNANVTAANAGLAPITAAPGTTPPGTTPTTPGSFSFPITPGSAAAVNNVSGIKDPSTNQFVQYPTPQDSFNATVQDVTNKINGKTSTGLNQNSTLGRFLTTWVNGPKSATLPGYANAVSQDLGIPLTTPVGQIDPTQLAAAISKHETGYNAGVNLQGTSQAGGVAPGTTGSSNIDSSKPGYSSQPVPGTGGLTQAVIDQNALRYALTGTMPAIGLASSGQGGLRKNAILNRAGELAGSANIAGNKAKLTSLNTSLGKQTDYLNTMERSINTVDDNLKILTDAAGKVNKADSPLINEWTNLAQSKVIGSGDLASYRSALQTVRTEYSNILARGGQVTDSVRSEAETLIPDNINKSQLLQVIGVLQAEGSNVKTEAQNQVDSIANQINNIVGGGSTTSTKQQTYSVGNQTYYQHSDGLYYPTP